VYGTFALPSRSNATDRVAAAVIVAGSGPTDRDGNTRLVTGSIDTLKNFANVLEAHGVASIRYDKLGSGQTGLASYASHPADISFDVYVDEATAAYNYLRSRPDVDPRRIMILGHSEGALIALVVAANLRRDLQPSALVLAAPPGRPYLETIQRQLGEQYAVAVQGGSVDQAKADAALRDVDRYVASIEQNGRYPEDLALADQSLAAVFSRANEHFLAGIARYDPVELALMMPAELPMLILHGAKDQQVSDDEVARLLAALRGRAAVVYYELPDADHVFKDVPGSPDPSTDYGNPALPFSPAAAQDTGLFLGSLSGVSR
jgi:alpha-beta hydrolase superfamily lysophospholipase